MNKQLKKSVSFVLVVMMVMSVFASVPFTTFAANDYTINSTTSTDDYYNLISKKDWDIAPGISESEIVLNNDDGSRRQVLYVMEADLNNEYVKVINSYNGMVPQYGNYKIGTMSQQAAYAEANGYGNVVGAMNTTLSWYTGYAEDRVNEPLGFIMVDAEIYFDPSNCGYTYGNVGFPSVLVINKDFDDNGNPRPADIPKVEMPQIRSAADLDGWEDQVIPCSSGYIVKDGVNVNASKPNHTDDAPRSVVGIKPDGTVVIMLNDGRQAPTSTGMSMYELAEVMLDLGCSFAVNCDGGGSSTYLSQRPGEELKVNNSPSDGAERPTTTGILFISTAPANGEFYKAHVSAENEYYTPNSKVQFNAIGTDMVGTEVEIPAEAVWQVADSSFGTIDNNGLFTSNGKEGEVNVQLVYNDEVVGEATITIVLPDIAFKTETIIIGYGDTMVLPIEVTTNEGRNTVTYSDGDIVYTLSNAVLGTLDGDKFTACSEEVGLTNGTITAVICGQTDKTVSAEIRFGKASEIAYDFEDGEFPVDTSKTGNIGGDDATDTGEYIYGWHINDTRANGYFSYRYYAKKSYTPIGYDVPAKVYLADSKTGKVKNGNYSMGIDIDWTNVTASCHGQMDIHLPESLDLTDATRVGFWMYIPAELVMASMNVNAGFTKTDGTTTRIDYTLKNLLSSADGIDNGGWYYFGWEVLDNYKSFDYVQINSHYQAVEGNYNYYQDVTYYIDDITVDYSDATIDRENPYFTSMTIADDFTTGVEVNGQTITTNTVTLMAQAYENTTKTNATGLNRESIKVYVDGVETTADVAMALNGTITVSDLYLNDGVHTIVMEISDNQGNVGNIVRKVVVNTEKSAVRLEVPAADGLLPTGSIYWVNLVADNLAAIDSVTTTINLDYVNDWELEGMEVAYGFKAEYYINAHNDAVITFTRTGTEVADTTVLAKLPVRIWMALGWMDDSGIRKDYISNDPAKQDKYYILTPHAMWYSDGTRDYRVVVSAEAGVVTYVDGSTMTFSANETVIQTEMNRYYSNTDKQGKWSFHIHTAGEVQNKAATCTEAGYTGRVFCVGCACGSVDNLGAECDTHNGCGSVIEWGEIIPATGHNDVLVNGVYVCENCGDENGIANGLIKDGDAYRYFVNGVAQSGWIMVDTDWHYFHADTLAAKAGKFTIDGIEYDFEETGKLVSGVWAKTLYGMRYFYGPGCYGTGWYEIDGNRYYFENTYRYEGYRMIFKAKTRRWYNFGDDGICREDEVINGFYWDADKGLGYVVDNVGVDGLHKIDGDYYYFNYYGYAVSGFTNVGSTYCDMPTGNYYFGEDYKAYTGLVEKNGVTYYYENGRAKMAGLVEVDGDLYFAGGANGEITVGKKQFVWEGNGILPEATYEFGADGKMLNGIVEKDGVLYYYHNGQPKMAGLVEIDGDYYFAGGANGEVTVGKVQYVWQDNGITLENPNCEFGADGKMLDGIVDKNGTLYYYVMGRPKMAGLINIDGDYYFAGGAAGEITVGKVQYVWQDNGIALDNANCEFGADGKMLDGIVDKNGTLYYYVMGRPRMAGLIEVDGALYFAGGANGEITVGKKTFVWQGNGILPEATYEFGADGKMLRGIVDKDGVLYYYVNGQPKCAGLVEVDGALYFAGGANGEITVGKKTFVWQGNGILAEGNYEFGKDGKMLNGFVTKDDGIYYYQNGKPGRVGLNYIDGDYYFVDYGGKLFTSGTYFVWETNGYSIGMKYTFDDLGRLILK